MITRKQIKKVMGEEVGLIEWAERSDLDPNDGMGAAEALTRSVVTTCEGQEPSRIYPLMVAALANAFAIGFETAKRYGKK